MVRAKSFRSRRGKVIMRFSRSYVFDSNKNSKYKLYLSDEKTNGKYTAQIYCVYGEHLLFMDFLYDIQMTEEQVKQFLKIIEEGKETSVPHNLKEDDVLIEKQQKKRR